MSKQSDITELRARHSGTTTIIGILVWLLLMTEIFTYTIMVVSRVILLFLLVSMLVVLHRYSDEIIMRGGLPWTDESRKKAKRGRWIRWGVVIALVSIAVAFMPNVWIVSLCGASAAVIYLRNRLVGHTLKLDRKLAKQERKSSDGNTATRTKSLKIRVTK